MDMDFTFQRPECGFRGTGAGLLDSVLPMAALQPSRGLSAHPCPAVLKTFMLRVGTRSPQALPIPSLPESPAFSPCLGSSVHANLSPLESLCRGPPPCSPSPHSWWDSAPCWRLRALQALMRRGFLLVF